MTQQSKKEYFGNRVIVKTIGTEADQSGRFRGCDERGEDPSDLLMDLIEQFYLQHD